MKLLVFAGTKNGRELVENLSKEGYELIVSSMSAMGDQMIDKAPNITTVYGQLEIEGVIKLIVNNQIDHMIDSTHPYAQQISENLLIASKITGIPLIRFERELAIPPSIGMHFSSLEGVLSYLSTVDGNILFTTGVNGLSAIGDRLKHERIFARILDTDESNQKAEDSGFPSEQIIKSMPPHSKDENIQAIIRHQIDFLVTKDSGIQGNIQEKIDAANETNIQLLVIDRPELYYENIAYTVEEMLLYLQRIMSSESS